MARKTRAELEAELRLLRRSRSGDGVVSVINNAIKFGSIVAVFYIIFLMVDALAGKTTDGNIIIEFVSKFEVNKWLAYILGGGGVTYGLAQKRLRRNTVQRVQPRVQKLEKKIDKRRSSSNLTARGETQPEDM